MKHDEPKMDYYAAARAVGLHLKEFCDNWIPYPDMIAEAARKARIEIEKLRAMQSEVMLRETLKAAERGMAYIKLDHPNPVARHAFEAIIKRCRAALGQEVPYVTSFDSDDKD